jgi:predicted transcriptional regulator
MLMNEPVAWKSYEEIHFSDQYILRWVREGDEYVNRITKEMMEDLQAVVLKQNSEIELLNAKLVYMFEQEIKSAGMNR